MGNAALVKLTLYMYIITRRFIAFWFGHNLLTFLGKTFQPELKFVVKFFDI